MKTLVQIFGVFLFLIACDPFSTATLKNERENDVVIQLTIDTAILQNYSCSKYVLLSSYALENTLSIINLDTSNMTGTYLLKGQTSTRIEGCNSGIVFYKFNKLRVLSGSDTIQFNSRKDIENAFKKVGNNRYELISK